MKKTISIERILVVFVTVVSVVAIYISYRLSIILAYNDATAHLNTARRIIDSLTPGIVQIGSVWLPLLHLLELPFVMNFFLWQSGLAGSIVSGISFILSSFILFKLLDYITHNKWASVVGSLAFIFNVNLLYLQTTAMFEPLLIVTALAAAFFLTKWTKEGDIRDLVLAAFFTMLATLTRYDGWALFLASCAYVVMISVILKHKSKDGALFLFISLAGFGIFLWLLYNYMIFSDPLYFMRGEYSAAAQQLVLFQRGDLPTKHNLLLSIKTYGLATWLNNGRIAVCLSITGLIMYLISFRKKIYFLAPLILLVPLFFNIVSLYLGQSVIWIPSLPPHFNTYFNARYGILLLPAVAFFIGFLASKQKYLMIFLVPLIFLQFVLFFKPSLIPYLGNTVGIVTLKDTVSSVNGDTRQASAFLHKNYNGGLILVSSASEDAFIFRAGLPLKDFITEGTGHYWKESLKNPTTYATWLVFFQDKTDRVGKVIGKSAVVPQYYTEVYHDQTYEIWKKKSAVEKTSQTFNFEKNDKTSVTWWQSLVPKAFAATPTPRPTLWKYQCIDTMKTSRDKARVWKNSPQLSQTIATEMQIIKNTGANCVAIDTPYDAEFLPYLTEWVQGARKENLHVWFRGGWSSWEGWFDYPKSSDTKKVIKDTKNFITIHPTLFQNGDIFTSIPEAENGGPFANKALSETDMYRQFLIDEKAATDASFKAINKNVIDNWDSMNGGVAKSIMDQATINAIGNTVTIDHYVKDPKEMGDFIRFFNNTYNAKVVIGEFGAPIPEINGSMTETGQAQFVQSLLEQMYENRNTVIGVNYWDLFDGSTALVNEDNTPRPVLTTITNYFTPEILQGTITNSLGDHLQGIVVKTKDGYSQTRTDRNGNYALLIPPPRNIQLLITGNDYYLVSKNISIVKSNKRRVQNFTVSPIHPNWLYKIRLFLKNVKI